MNLTKREKRLITIALGGGLIVFGNWVSGLWSFLIGIIIMVIGAIIAFLGITGLCIKDGK